MALRQSKVFPCVFMKAPPVLKPGTSAALILPEISQKTHLPSQWSAGCLRKQGLKQSAEGGWRAPCCRNGLHLLLCKNVPLLLFCRHMTNDPEPAVLKSQPLHYFPVPCSSYRSSVIKDFTDYVVQIHLCVSKWFL